MHPGISCVCITYGRPASLLEEAIESFRRQDYEGPKELFILNDCQSQTFHCDAKDVTIVNIKRRFRTVGEKRNAAIALCRYDILACWDDDDISLPHRLTYSIDRARWDWRYYKPARMWIMGYGDEGACSALHGSSLMDRKVFEDAGRYPAKNCGEDGALSKQLALQTWRGAHGASLMTREVLHEAGCYPSINSGQDIALEQALARTDPEALARPIKTEDIFYIYRWGNTGSHHLSAFRDQRRDEQYQSVDLEYARAFKEGRAQAGDIRLTPRWGMDYTAWAKVRASAHVDDERQDADSGVHSPENASGQS
jgi:glycosyltransferase involved in cell wall biosynthesis